jgi:hypothetical protein
MDLVKDPPPTKSSSSSMRDFRRKMIRTISSPLEEHRSMGTHIGGYNSLKSAVQRLIAVFNLDHHPRPSDA